jgi:glycosyltransferase involved in cell wall biosynthesis
MISFIIPAHQEEKYIERTLRDIPNNFEKIVVCNSCTDQTYNIAKKYAKVINISEKNVSKARNLGAQISKNDFLVFLDADTKLSKNAFSLLLRLKDKNIIGTFKMKYDKNKIYLRLISFVKNIFPLFKIHNSSGVIFCDRNAFNKAHGFNEKLVKKENGNFINKAKKYSKFYFSKNYSITSSRRFEKIGCLRIALYWLKDLFIKNKYYPAIR